MRGLARCVPAHPIDLAVPHALRNFANSLQYSSLIFPSTSTLPVYPLATFCSFFTMMQRGSSTPQWPGYCEDPNDRVVRKSSPHGRQVCCSSNPSATLVLTSAHCHSPTYRA